MNACSACAMRDASTTVRDNGMGSVDLTMGLEELGNQLFACRTCGQRYERTEDLSEAPFLFRDYDLLHYRKLEPVLTRAAPPAQASPPPRPPVEDKGSYPRCPRCHSWDVAFEPVYELTRLTCRGCGHDAFVDWTERDEWDALEQDREAARRAEREKPAAVPPPVFAEVARLERPGCARCAGPDATAAWAALHAVHEASPVREVHFGIDVKRCACGQPWVVVFAERVDYRDGDDDQTWLAVPVTNAEVAVLTTCEPSRLSRAVAELGRDRRFLLRSNASGPASWREGGFAIPPHD